MQERPLYFVGYEVEPLPGSENITTASGAFANVWIDATSKEEALRVSAREVLSAGWTILSLETAHEVTRKDYADDTSGLEFYDQALIDGIVLVFHTWQGGTQH